uniref:Uncharacterized protein n=1 Tax=Panagrolaimus davidi TaxID=227884 RepID=A0A914Q557_9BILA
MKIKKPKKRDDTIIFLTILEEHFPKMLTATRRIDIWEEILQDCHQYGLLLNRDSKFLYQSRWPSLTRTTLRKWRNKKPLDEKDKLIISICHIDNPDFCKDVVEENEKAADDTADDVLDNIGGDFDSVESMDDYTKADSVIKELVEYMVKNVSEAQEVDDYIVEISEGTSDASVQEFVLPSTDEQTNGATSNEQPNLSSPDFQAHFLPSLTNQQLPPPPIFFSPNTEQAQLAALQAYENSCKWITYKTQLEIEVLKKNNTVDN